MSLEDKLENLTEENAPKSHLEMGLDGGEFTTGALTEPIAEDWTPILKSFGLDPDVFMVEGDKVRMSKWQQSKRLENGDRDIVWMYSYKAIFKRRMSAGVSEDEFNKLRSRVQDWKPIKRTLGTGLGEPCSFVVHWADWQLGKSAGGGVVATIDRVEESFEKTEQRIKQLKKMGKNIEGLVIANMGDPVEGCDGNYASQLFTVELTQREQLLLALDLWTQGIKRLAPLTDHTTFLSVISNHGEWMRRGGKQVTSDSDSADAFLADTLQRIFAGSDHVDKWIIPHDEMTVQHEVSGVPTAFTHGHKISGKEIDWLRSQSIRLLREHGTEPRLWFTAHKHHVKGEDMGPWWRWQCPSLDGGSKWFLDMAGVWSTPGTLSMLVGNHDKRNWSDMEVL
jgi:hypothetical protein